MSVLNKKYNIFFCYLLLAFLPAYNLNAGTLGMMKFDSIPDPNTPVYENLKELYLNTKLIDGYKPAITIVTPNLYFVEGLAIAKTVEMITGVSIPVLNSDSVEINIPIDRNLILLGNRSTNNVIGALFDRAYTFLDLKYPGSGGYVVRSLHNPFGNGKNVLFTGGSDLNGVKLATASLIKFIEASKVKPGSLSVNYLAEIKLGAEYSLPPDLKDIGIWEASERYKSSGYFGWNKISKNMALFYMPRGVRLEYIQLSTYEPPQVPQLVKNYQPKFLPPLNRPRLWVNQQTLPEVRARLEIGENLKEWWKVKKSALIPFVFEFNPDAEISFDAKLEKAAETKAFYYLMTEDEVIGREAINLMVDYISHVEFGNLLDITREIGRAIYTASLVYDWCYDLLSPEERKIFYDNLMRLSEDLVGAYSSKIKSYTREFCFLNLDQDSIPAAIIMSDNITTSNPKFKKFWQINTHKKPRIDNNSIILRNDRRGLAGKTHVDMLIPSIADREIEILSGTDAHTSFEFKYELPGRLGKRDLPEKNGHRIMVSPKVANSQDRYLTVFQLSAGDTKPLPIKNFETEVSNVVVIANRVVSLNNKVENLINEEFILNVPEGGEFQILLSGMEAGDWNVKSKDDEMMFKTTVQDGKNTIFFLASSGEYEITPGLLADAKTLLTDEGHKPKRR